MKFSKFHICVSTIMINLEIFKVTIGICVKFFKLLEFDSQKIFGNYESMQSLGMGIERKTRVLI